ncbi:hypothetical protein GCM10010121_012670 [Streptomyces brasiliensis]|uniref:Uncharacterized protein n=1 Tax=Streptomyces brasiliensis TaxID=1954 RepID=A0A917K9N1_9ACTN|nr:hypothetical protein GCM10010121_012670 [Streptomyces brasiliensis]
MENLGLEMLDVVNLRLGDAQGPQPGSLAEALETLVELQRQGLIRQFRVQAAPAAGRHAAVPVVDGSRFLDGLWVGGRVGKAERLAVTRLPAFGGPLATSWRTVHDTVGADPPE